MPKDLKNVKIKKEIFMKIKEIQHPRSLRENWFKTSLLDDMEHDN